MIFWVADDAERVEVDPGKRSDRVDSPIEVFSKEGTLNGHARSKEVPDRSRAQVR